MRSTTSLVKHAASGGLFSAGDALALAELPLETLAELCEAAARKRDRARGRIVTFSPKVFLPLTNLCRNRCDYCSYRRSAGDEGAWTMAHAEVDDWIARGRAAGCCEALFCLGDKPESAFASYRRELGAMGHGGTVDYLEWAGERALAAGLLPHTNAGVLSKGDMRRLKRVNVSMGLMLESASDRLCEKGMPHHRAPDKRPAVRLRMHEEAGALGIAFTSGILLGIGETRRERVEALLAIREVHLRHGHVQEVIVQNFTPRPGIAMAGIEEPDDATMAHAVALARLVLPEDVSVQSPPNLNPARTALLLRAGLDDFGGISPVTPDYISPRHAWPQLGALAQACAEEGFELRPRLPVHERFIEREGFLDAGLREAVERERVRLAADGEWWRKTLLPASGGTPPASGRRADDVALGGSAGASGRRSDEDEVRA